MLKWPRLLAGLMIMEQWNAGEHDVNSTCTCTILPLPIGARPKPETEVCSCKSSQPELWKWHHEPECCTCQSRVPPPLQEGCWCAEPGLGDLQLCLMCFQLCVHKQRWTLSVLFHHGSGTLQMSLMTVTEGLLRPLHSSFKEGGLVIRSLRCFHRWFYTNLS